MKLPRGRIKAAAFIALFPLCVLTFANRPQRSASLNDKLHERQRSYALRAAGFVDALMSAAGQFQIPMGIVWTDTPASRAPVSLSWNDATVQGIIADIARTQPGYTIEVSNSIVHVFPRGAVPDNENFLKLRIKEFSAHDEFVQHTSRRLETLVNRIVSPPKPPPPGFRGGQGFSEADTAEYPKVTVDAKDYTVEQILDTLAVASPRKIWTVTFENSPKLTPTGFRRTRSLWNKNSIPDQYQPVWDMFHWGDKIPNP